MKIRMDIEIENTDEILRVCKVCTKETRCIVHSVRQRDNSGRWFADGYLEPVGWMKESVCGECADRLIRGLRA